MKTEELRAASVHIKYFGNIYSYSSYIYNKSWTQQEGLTSRRQILFLFMNQGRQIGSDSNSIPFDHKLVDVSHVQKPQNKKQNHDEKKAISWKLKQLHLWNTYAYKLDPKKSNGFISNSMEKKKKEKNQTNKQTEQLHLLSFSPKTLLNFIWLRKTHSHKLCA